MEIEGKNTLINSLTGLQTIKDESDAVVETHMNTQQIMGYVLSALMAIIVFRISPQAKDWVARLI